MAWWHMVLSYLFCDGDDALGAQKTWRLEQQSGHSALVTWLGEWEEW